MHLIRLAPGQIVDRYEVEGLIGQGGLAEVYRVRHRELGQRAALKVLRRESAGIFQRTMREGRLQASLHHKNVVAVYDVLRIGDAPALVMEYVAGPSLEQLLRQYHPSLTQADLLARGVLSGVMAAHRAGLIHRDLKPANVLIAVEDELPVPKVADFGLARAAIRSDEGALDPRLTREGSMLGTPAYMAPEQFSDAASVDERADVFGLGALLYELISGVMAFPGRDAMECYRSIVQSSWRPLRELVPSAPTRMIRAVEAALEPDAERRVGTVEQLLAIWTGEAEGRYVALPEPPIWEAEHMVLVGSLTPELWRGDADGGTPRSGSVQTPELTQDWAVPSAGSAAALLASTLPDPGELVGTATPPEARPPAAAPPSVGDGPSLDELRGGPSRRALFGAGGALALLGIVVALWALLPLRPKRAAAPPSPAEDPAEATDLLAAEAAPPAPAAEPAEATVPLAEAPRASTPRPAEPTPQAQPASPPPPAEPSPAQPERADNVIVSGVSRAWLVADNGTRLEPGVVPPGHYALYVFFDPAHPTRVLDLDVVAGRTLRVRCEPGLRSCR